jgi:hypothetical protein
MDLHEDGFIAAVASCLRDGGKAFGMDAEEWADVILCGGEPQDLYDRLAALIEPNNEQTTAVRRTIINEIIQVAEA